MQVKQSCHRGPYDVKPDPDFDRALALIAQGYTRNAAAKAVGRYPQYIRERFRRLCNRYGYPELPDGRCKQA